MKVTIRRAILEDVETLDKLFEEFLEWKLDRSTSIRQTISSEASELLVATVNGNIVGFVNQVFFEDPSHGGLNSFITDLYVQSKHRSEGIGSTLLDRALETAKRKDVMEVHVTTRKSNNRAIQFYTSHGFSKEGVLMEYESKELFDS